ncbi:MAG: FKBP-type peptidyl-prolyl cis-trans isomerase [Gemmatimonadaceae bacterium]
MRLKTLFAALVPLSFAACLGSTDPVSYPNIPIESTTFASSLGVSLATSTKTSTGMYYRDITVGTGATIATGQTANVYYAGALSNGAVFDAKSAPATPFQFKIGAGTVIPGWEQGVVGMKVDGVRQLIIPPGLGYGAAFNGPIPPNSVLIFNITLVSIQ